MQKPADAADVRSRVGQAQPAGSARHHRDSGRRSPLEKDARLRGARLPRGRRLHGSRATGPPTSPAAPSSATRCSASSSSRTSWRSCCSRSSARLGIASGRDLAQACRDTYSHAHDVRPVDRLRDRDRRLRPRRSARRGHRAAAAVRHPASVGCVPDGDRRVPGAVSAEPRLPLRRSDRADADSRHRRLFCDRALDGTARSGRAGRRA